MLVVGSASISQCSSGAGTERSFEKVRAAFQGSCQPSANALSALPLGSNAIQSLKSWLEDAQNVTSEIRQALLKDHEPEKLSKTKLISLMKKELGDNWRDRFSSFEDEPFAVSSIAQLWQRRQSEGRRRHIQHQEQLLPLHRRPLLFGHLTKEWRHEHNYQKEAEQQNKYREKIHNYEQSRAARRDLKEPALCVPSVVNDLTTKKVLTTEFAEGIPLREVAEKLPFSVRLSVARSLLRLFTAELTSTKLMKAEANEGDFIYCPDTNRLFLLDFGTTESLHGFSDNVLSLWRGLRDMEREYPRVFFSLQQWQLIDLAKGPLGEIISDTALASLLISICTDMNIFFNQGVILQAQAKLREYNSTVFRGFLSLFKETEGDNGVRPQREEEKETHDQKRVPPFFIPLCVVVRKLLGVSLVILRLVKGVGHLDQLHLLFDFRRSLLDALDGAPLLRESDPFLTAGAPDPHPGWDLNKIIQRVVEQERQKWEEAEAARKQAEKNRQNDGPSKTNHHFGSVEPYPGYYPYVPYPGDAPRTDHHSSSSQKWETTEEAKAQAHQKILQRDLEELSRLPGLTGEDRVEWRPPYQFQSGSSYSGEWKGNKRHGWGKMGWPDGTSYEGEWKETNAEGKGRLRHSDGEVYIGEWKNNTTYGFGTHFHQNSTSYSGGWKNDLQYRGEFYLNDIHGIGTYKWADGKSFSGEWKNNKLDGMGTFEWPDGRRYSGTYTEDRKKGFGIFHWNDGRRYEGFWKDGKQHGQGRFFQRNGVSRLGEYENGQRLRILSEDSREPPPQASTQAPPQTSTAAPVGPRGAGGPVGGVQLGGDCAPGTHL
uniref:ABC1 atypical kinase-like domain-containing protein n=1 Tax=Chromera velia CCMP2878 TaxID=1169474 RepID=A0A0G4GCL5_9ALVE|eukprot:Cvel_21307.t1-p1 / transcript=Cvel_21307.t1 / gene=Cvel_21307 / organism=Chromera_velia_CCMP2878 / gene_product=Phosphatidylinositol 4-phosphate 5-kinase 8, putative / transcript_product=Phosphatidylinositol 4-phosphate 5-kinase 8, putative / location=Cvel_scaffold1986:8689-16912(+) / protein_length=823 / sequence_SO=supercontig / SO=protein_coding / is_pseudo=false